MGEEKIRSNFVLVYELFDEVMDHGYPQIVDSSLLQQFIHHGKASKKTKMTALEEARTQKEILEKVTGATPWRAPGKYTYAKNEVYLDVIENVNVIISRFYKSDYSRVAAEAFRVKVVASKNYNSPCLLLDRSSFLFIRKNDLVITAVTKKNVNANLVYHFLYQLVEVFGSYFDNEFNEEKIRSNFVLVYELFDEVMDHGYPQIVDPGLLQQFIHHGTKTKITKMTALEEARTQKEILEKV